MLKNLTPTNLAGDLSLIIEVKKGGTLHLSMNELPRKYHIEWGHQLNVNSTHSYL